MVVFAAVAGLSQAGCGTGEATVKPAPDYATMLAGAPEPLAALHRQGNTLLDGRLPAFEKRMAGLAGFPVVVNIWASWCGPCRAEFPHFQQVSAKLGRTVAFLGVDSDDDADAAATFLESYPVPYPSFYDPDWRIAASIGNTRQIPVTVFFDRSGKETYTKFGPYGSAGDLERDIREHALAPSGQADPDRDR